LGAEGRRFESCLPDHFHYALKYNVKLVLLLQML